jgi:hypothetical protein
MAVPDFLDFGSPEIEFGAGSSNAQRTPAMPTHQVGQTMLCYVAGDGNAPTLQTANGWVLGVDLAGNQASSAISGQCSIRIYWKRAATTTEAAPIISDPTADGNTCGVCHINLYSNVRLTGTPFHKIITATVTSPTTAIATPPVTTTIADCMIGAVAASAFDDSLFQNWANTGATTSSIDSGFNTSIGNDCSWTGGRAPKPTAGTVTLTSSFQTSTQQAQISFAIASVTEGGAGDAALTTADFSTSATGILEIQGTSSLTLADFSVSAQEDPASRVGVSALTLADATTSSTGTLDIQASASLTLEAFTVSAQQGSAISIGSSTVKQRINASQPTSGTWTTDPISTETGSVLVACLMRGVWVNAANPKEPTDSQGNTWTEIHDFAYNTFPNSRAGIWYCVNNSGSGSHTFSMTFGSDNAGGGDEVTISIIELKGVSALQAFSHVERAVNATTASGIAITPTAPSICLSWICGNGSVGITHVFAPDSTSTTAGWSVNSGASATGDPSNNGYIQVTVAALLDVTGANIGASQNCTYQNQSTPEGGQIFQQAFQTILGQVGDVSVTLDNLTTVATLLLDSFVGTSSLTIDDFTTQSLAVLAINGTSDLTASDFSIQSTAALAITGSSSSVIDDFSSSASGQVSISGSSDLTLSDVTIQSSAGLSINGASSLVIDDFTTQSSAELAIVGSSTLALSDFSISADGEGLISTNGSADLVVADFSITVTGELAIAGSANLTASAFVIGATGSLPIVAGASISLDECVLASSGTSDVVPIAGTASLVVGAMTLNALGQLEIRGSSALVFAISISASGIGDGPQPSPPPPFQAPVFRTSKNLGIKPKIRRRK